MSWLLQFQFTVWKALQLLQGIELKEKEKENVTKNMGKLIKKSAKWKMSIASALTLA